MSTIRAVVRLVTNRMMPADQREVKRLIRLGDAANRQRLWPAAAEAYQSALAMDPELDAIWVQFGHALKEQGFLIRAEQAYRRALAIDDSNADTHLQLGHVLKLQGRSTSANAAYRSSFARDPSSPHSRAELVSAGQIFLDLDNDTEIEDVVGAQFDRGFYLQQHPDLKDTDPLQHYLKIGWTLGWDPSPEFSTSFYLDRSPDVRSLQINPFYHYLTQGRFEGRAASKTDIGAAPNVDTTKADLVRTAFDPKFYMANNPAMLAQHADPLLHYLHTGWRLGYDPAPSFSTLDYMEMNPDVVASDENPLVHFIRAGRSEGRFPIRPPCLTGLRSNGWIDDDTLMEMIETEFDRRYYVEQYSDIFANRLDPVEHYIHWGANENRDPAPWFSTEYYKQRYPGVVRMNINPLLHYVLLGRAENFVTYVPDQGAASAKLVPGRKLVESQDLRALLRDTRGRVTPPVASRQTAKPAPADPRCLDIHWIIPDFNAGGGGHMTIFRMVKWLEFFGHTCTIWVQSAVFDRTDQDRAELLLRNFQVVRAQVRTLPPNQDFEGVDALVATGWDSAYVVREATGPKAKFYFVQDYEPFFYPVGSRSLASRETYSFGLTCICASQWLKGLMEQHGNVAYAFDLAADESYVASAGRKPNAVPRIAFYAREHTTRRAVELGLLALELLAERGGKFHVDFFGNDHHLTETPFPATSWGIQDPSELSKLYGQVDLGVCFSATNYSLVPQEMMACGLPVVELDTESTRAAFPEGVVAMAHPTPQAIADTLSRMLNDREARQAIAAKGSEWVDTLSWERSARAVERAMLEGLGLPPAAQPPIPADTGPNPLRMKATVVIPTYNAGPLFRTVLERVLSQRTPWPFEVVVVDSGSTDGTWEYVSGLGTPVIARQIHKSEFQHGRTRNLGISLGSGEYAAVLTQDALPVDEFWLYNMVVTLDRFPRAAGAFGRHRAWPDSSPFVKRDIEAHFALFDNQPMVVSRYTDVARFRNDDIDYKRFLHFFSDNNACLRRSVWLLHPYPEVDYGEDQMWAELIVKAGYAKIYVQKAVVFHAHDYDEDETFERAKVEASFFRTQFGYDSSPGHVNQVIRTVNAGDERWGVRNGVSQEQIERQKKLNAKRMLGFASGAVSEGGDRAFDVVFDKKLSLR